MTYVYHVRSVFDACTEMEYLVKWCSFEYIFDRSFVWFTEFVLPEISHNSFMGIDEFFDFQIVENRTVFIKSNLLNSNVSVT